MRISDWSSDVCSSDLHCPLRADRPCHRELRTERSRQVRAYRCSLSGARRGPERLDGRGRMGYGLPRICSGLHPARRGRSEEHTSELQSLMRISYAVFCLKQNITAIKNERLSVTYNDTYHKTSTS